MQTNIPAVLSVMQFIYNNIMYAELNTKSDFCEKCGYDGEIKIVEDEAGKLVWECPNCGNRDQNKLFVARRTCGYIGTQFWNQAGLRRSGTGCCTCKIFRSKRQSLLNEEIGGLCAHSLRSHTYKLSGWFFPRRMSPGKTRSNSDGRLRAPF